MAGYDDSMFGNLPRPRRPGQGRPLNAQDIAAMGGIGTLAPANQSWSEQLGGAAANAAEATRGAPSRQGSQNASDITQKFVGLVPGVGQALSGNDAYRAAQQGNYGQATLAALGAVPIPGAKAAPLVEGAAENIARSSITAYHGSPHSFDRFDISKIGTGEGAQAYGHGLYFAGNEDVAKEYRDTLSKLDFSEENLTDEGRAKFERMQTADPWRSRDSTLNIMPEMYFKPTGSMYQVNINADPDHFLDWDKPLSEQSPHVQQNLADVLRYQKVPLNNNAGGETTGGQMMGHLQSRFGNAADAAGELSGSNIPGIKYLDQGSRGAGGEGGTQNYVTFSDNMIDILKKYGLAGLGLTAGAGALSASGQSPVSSPAEAAPLPQGMTLNTQPNWGAP